jgi:hypothetical protein
VQVKPSPSLFEKEYLKWEKESGSSWLIVNSI